MDIHFTCPRCGQSLTAEERRAEMIVNCPNCQQQIEIPPASALQTPEASIAAVQAVGSLGSSPTTSQPVVPPNRKREEVKYETSTSTFRGVLRSIFPSKLSRKQYLIRTFITIAVVIAGWLFCFGIPSDSTPEWGIGCIPYVLILVLAIFYNIFGLSIPRLRSAQISLWTVLLVLLPCYGVLLLFVICVAWPEKGYDAPSSEKASKESANEKSKLLPTRRALPNALIIPPETDTKPEAPKRDVLELIETTISGLLRLVVSLFFTTYTFLVRPRQMHFDDARVTRPLTFLFVSFFGYTGLFLLVFTFAPPHGIPLPPTVGWGISAFTNWDYKGLLALLSPVIIEVALFALTIAWASRAAPVPLTFGTSLALASYFAGTIGFVYVAFMPIFILSLSFPLDSWALLSFTIVFGIIGWALLFRGAFAYLCLLKRELGCTRTHAIQVFFAGSALCLGLSFALFLYSLPVIWLMIEPNHFHLPGVAPAPPPR
jgi:uncharacterized membrane protein YhaH (DUF805 family)